MEIELKYKIPSAGIAEDIWRDKLFSEMEEEDSREEICLDAKYFDTDNCDLAKKEIAYRVRKEGERIVAALKWKGRSEGALHVREEISVPVMSEDPDPSVFGESEIGRELVDILDGKEVSCFLETKYNRKRFRIDTGTGIFEISIDTGKILTACGEEPISEVEIELFSGETEELMEIGERIRNKYDLETEDASKYLRGINIIKKNQN